MAKTTTKIAPPMKVTQTHLDFWESHQRRPSWAAKIKKPKVWPGATVDLIDSCINIQGGIRPTHSEIHISNLISLIHRKVGVDTRALVTYLYYLAGNEDPMHKRRAATAKKWANKIRFGNKVPRVLKTAVAV